MSRITIARTWPASLAFAALVLAPASARAQQLDVNPPLPNVLLLIDNSGSMERMIDGTLPEASPATACNCDPGTGACNWAAQPSPNRWGVLLQTLTGTLQNGYNCAAMPRTAGSVFTSEYQINGVAPYDTNYYLPYHRPIGQDTTTAPGTPLPCVYAPGALPGVSTPNGVGMSGVGAPGNATDFPSSAIVNNHTYGVVNTKTCAFPQATDGMIDAERDIMRFGLMTFDQDPDPGTGVTANTNQVLTPAFTGNWSYFPGWNTGAAPPASLFGDPTYYGNPASCTTQTIMAVGARNPAAPPWEGRMIPFPATTDLAAQETQNDHVQQVLMASRPYGATPLAGMLLGARYYYQQDPTGPQLTDPYVQGGCRDEFIILLTDGAPNLDMRTACEASGSPNGVCPFIKPEATVTALKTPASGRPVTTYVVGFAVSSFVDQGQTIYCSSLVNNGQLAAVCNDPTKQTLYGPCCELQQIALNGGTTSAYFADTPGDLQGALGSILAQIAKKQTTRTIPSYSPIVSNAIVDPNAPPSAASNSSVYLASFTPSPGQPWSGDIQRQRFTCESAGQSSNFTVATQAIDRTLGDDFAANLNSNVGARTIVLLQPDTLPSGTGVDSTATIRPYVTNAVGDGLGEYGVTTFAGDPATVISKITPPALALTNTNCGTYNARNGGGLQPPLSATQCRDMILDYALAVQSFSGQPNFPFVSRYGNAFGDIFHAVPTVVGPPASLLRDDSYVAFRSLYATRKQAVYATTNDGLLHAFWADENKLENNEIWALMPPAVMPNLLSSYPASHQFLLDGSPVTKDVVWDRPLSNQGDPRNWHTTLVAGFGSSHQGYYAVDVTSTVTAGIPQTPAEPSPVGPVFLWQLTKMPATNMQLFGAQAGTPAITTLFVDPGDGNGAREIGVAILPGGQNTPAATFMGGVAQCPRLTKPSTALPLSGPGSTFRGSVRCWGTPPSGNAPSVTDPVIGRSLSIVRLDTGEILRTFTRLGDVPSTDTLFVAKRVTDTALDSPMTGTPVVYPSDIGTDATKAFAGDADGTIWRFDLSSPNPADWVGEMYLDLYNDDATGGDSLSWSKGQPLQVALVTSLDPQGQLVINATTGSTDTFDTTGTYYTYSMTETVQGSKLRANPNWWIDPAKVTAQAGERVAGPMTVFDGVLYFATFAAAPAGTQACTSGHARIWGLDFVAPADTTTLSKGGMPRLNPLPALHPQYLQPDETDATLSGVVIPGVSINATPACADTASTADPYVAGASHSSPSANFTSGGYSVFSQLGTSGTKGSATRQFSMSVPQPISPTMIDSWAAVLE